MWALYVAGYGFMAYSTFVIFRNNYITTKYRKYLKDSDSLWDKEWALDKAKINLNIDLPFLVFAGIFWFVCLPSLVLYKMAQCLPKMPVFRSKAEKDVEASKTNKALSEAHKTEWENALRTMDEAGIDTKELRKIEID